MLIKLLMSNIIFPDYKNSIINLMSSISKSYNKKQKYCELNNLPSKELKKYDNIILIVIDGLGYNYLMKQKDSFLKNNLISKLTSCFPPTTACANTIFHTCQTPNETGITGWDTYLKNIGTITSILPFSPMIGGNFSDKIKNNLKKFINIKSIYKNLKVKSYVIMNEEIKNSNFSKLSFNGARVIGRKSLTNSFIKLKKLIKKKSKSKRFIHLYISEFDHESHKFGNNSKKARLQFNKIDKKIKNFYKQIKKTNSKIIISADHGFISTKKKEVLYLDDFKELKECLILPFSSEPRAVSCFVKPFKIKDFETITKKLNKYFNVIEGSELIKNNIYGLTKNYKDFNSRVGDYVLLMKKNYVFLYSKDINFMKGNHGGISSDEMYVPLITLN